MQHSISLSSHGIEPGITPMKVCFEVHLGSITIPTVDLLFDWFGFNQTSKYVTNSA